MFTQNYFLFYLVSYRILYARCVRASAQLFIFRICFVRLKKHVFVKDVQIYFSVFSKIDDRIWGGIFMFLKEILERLEEWDIHYIRNENSRTDFTGIKMLTKDQKVFLPNVLYFGHVDMLPKDLLFDYSTNFMLYGPEVKIMGLYVGHAPMTLLYLAEASDPFVVYNTIQEIFLESQQVVTGMRLFLDALFNDEGLQGILDVGYSVLGNPLFLSDNSYKYLAVSSGAQADNPLMEKENSLGRIEKEGIEFIRRNKVDDRVRKSHRPYYLQNPIHNYKGMMIGSVKIHDIEVAHIMMYEQNHLFRENDYELMNRLCRIISIEMQKTDFYKKNKGTMYAYFIGDLLDNNAGNIEQSRERLAALGYTLQNDLFVLSVSNKYNTASEAKQDMIVSDLQNMIPDSLYVIYQNTIIFLINGCAEEDNHRFNNAQVETYLKSNNLIAGLSNCFSNIQEIRKYYEQSLKAAQLGLKMNNAPGLCRYEAMTIFHLMEISESEDYSLLDFCHPALLVLKSYDEAKNTDFFNTLYQYLNFSQNTQRTADYLHIHKNTLLYRIEKIKKITGNPLNHGDELIKLHFSFKILEYLGHEPVHG